jgi:hypothetical protein
VSFGGPHVSLHRSSDHARAAVVAGALLAVVALIWIIYRHSAPQSLPQPSLATLKSELAAIHAPAGSRLEVPTEEEAKIGSVQVIQRFELPQPAAEARTQFRAELLSHGWRLKSDDNAELWSDSYCKASFVAHVKLTQEASSTSHIALSMSWNELSLLLCGSGPA